MIAKTPAQQLEDLKTRLAALQERRTRVQVKLEAEKQALAEAQAEARAMFGTADLEELRALYRQRQQDNDKALQEFASALEDAERRLTDVERQAQIN